MLWLQHVFFIGCDTLIALRKTIILSCIVTILTFNFTMGYAKADTLASKFAEESLPHAFAGTVQALNTMASGAMHTEEYLAEHAKEMYDTALATFPQMSADMQNNFKSSLSQISNGIVTVGDWITTGLDSLKGKFGSEANLNGTASYDSGITSVKLGVGLTFYMEHKKYDRTFSANKFELYYTTDATSTKDATHYSITVRLVNYNNYLSFVYTDKPTSNPAGNLSQGKAMAGQIRNISSVMALKSYLAALGVSTTVHLNGSPLVETPYNRMDEWLRGVAIPAGSLGVYAPAEAWTQSGYRLGLSEDGQTLLRLPDGLPYDPTIDGPYAWRPPLTQVIDGVPAVLDPLSWDWVNVRDRTKVRPAEIPEIAEYVGTDVATAEEIKNKTEEKPEETTNAKLKNPTKKIVWTPLMMTGDAMTKKFPFSIPWDFANQLKVFDVSPQAPKIEINKPNFFTVDGQKQSMIWTIDFSYLNPIAAAVRWFAIIAFDIGLILMIRRIMPE